MREYVETLTLEGRTVRVSATGPASVEPALLAIGTALTLFERYPVLDGLALRVGATEIGVTRDQVERLLGPAGFGQLREWGRGRQVRAQVIQGFLREHAG